MRLLKIKKRFKLFITALCFSVIISNSIYSANVISIGNIEHHTQYFISKPFIQEHIDESDPTKKLHNISFNRTNDICELTNKTDENDNINLNLLIKIKNIDNENLNNPEHVEKSLLLENLNNELTAAIVFNPSHAKSEESMFEIKHQAKINVQDSSEPGFEKFLTTTFTITPEKFNQLKQLQHPEIYQKDPEKQKKGAADFLSINIYKKDTNFLNLIGYFEIKETDPIFI